MSAPRPRCPWATTAIKSTGDPGPGTLDELLAGLEQNVLDSARHEQLARAQLDRSVPGGLEEKYARGWIVQARSDQTHWRRELAVYREYAAHHPELRDKRVGTRCAHGPKCTLTEPAGREVGADDDSERPAPAHWSDPKQIEIRK